MALWRQYRRRAHWTARGLRVAAWSIGYLFAAGLLACLFGRPFDPSRGEGLSGCLQSAAEPVAVVGMVCLTFHVLDATQLCCRLARNLTGSRTEWPRRSTAELRQWPHDVACECLDIQLIADLTKPVRDFILFPAIVLSVLLAARTSWFDRWHWPWWLLAVYFTAFAVALYCDFRLRRDAEKSRREVLGRLEADVQSAVSENKPETVNILREAIQEIRSNHTGAFAPHYHSTVISALIPSLGLSLVPLLEMWFSG